MKVDLLINYIKNGREIEFAYKGKMYSITYSPDEENDYISFCEFYKDPTNITSIDELLRVSQNEVTVQEMWESLNEKDIWIY